MKKIFEVDGIELLVEGQGPRTVVMVHGWPDTYRVWDAQVAALQAQYRCVRFTLPGFDIAKPRQAYSLDEMVATLLHIVDRVSPNAKVTLLLHDWGCVFGYQFYMCHPERVDCIVGVDIGDADSPQYQWSLSLAGKLMVASYQGLLALAWKLGGRLGDALTRGMATVLKVPSPRQHISAAMNFPYYIFWTGSHGSYRHRLAFVPQCPMLFVYGTQKPFMFHSPQWAQALNAKPGSQVLALDTDHWPMLRQPQEFNQALMRWLAAPGAQASPRRHSQAA
jgi:pimeloyl-ACP methyl ester carboxylesterase